MKCSNSGVPMPYNLKYDVTRPSVWIIDGINQVCYN